VYAAQTLFQDIFFQPRFKLDQKIRTLIQTLKHRQNFRGIPNKSAQSPRASWSAPSADQKASAPGVHSGQTQKSYVISGLSEP